MTTRGGAPLINLRVLARPPVAWALMALLVATGTYYALLFTLAQFLQRGLGHSALGSGLTLVPWVAAFGAAGQIVRRLPSRLAAYAPATGCLLLAVAYAAIGAALFSGHRSATLLLVLLAFGGLGLGINFSAIIAHLTNAVPAGYAADISGVSSTTAAIGGAIGIAGFGTLYLALAQTRDAADAFATVAAAFAAAAMVAAFGARRGTRGDQRILRQGCPKTARSPGSVTLTGLKRSTPLK
jgi:MFS family permease